MILEDTALTCAVSVIAIYCNIWEEDSRLRMFQNQHECEFRFQHLGSVAEAVECYYVSATNMCVKIEN